MNDCENCIFYDKYNEDCQMEECQGYTEITQDISKLIIGKQGGRNEKN